jgi:glycoprotein-N-acetylgalactosamine 3-beta-galactosyltransferase
MIVGSVLQFTIFSLKVGELHYLIKSNFYSSDALQLQTNYSENRSKYDTTLADKLFNEVKIFCLILTQPKDHEKKAQYAKENWANKCNKFMFLSSINDTQLGAFGFPYNESRDILWGKVRQGFLYAHDNFLNDFDWFLKGDDDS